MSPTHSVPTIVADVPPPGRLGHFVDIARWRAERFGDQVAFTFLAPGEGKIEAIRYGELDARCRRIAAALRERGTPGQRVLIVQNPGLDYICSLLGCLYAGMIAVPVYPLDLFRLRHSLPRLAAITRDAEAEWGLTAGDALGGTTNESQVLGSLWDRGPAGVLRTDRLDGSADTFEVGAIDRDDVAILQYTSGTTAAPRGVVLRHRHLIANANQIYSAYHVPDAVCVFWLPPYHDMGLVGGLLLPLYAGRPSVLMSPASFVQDPASWLRAISDYRGTTTASPNFGFELCLRKVRDETLDELDLSSLRVTISGAEPIRASTMRRFTERFARRGFRPTAFTPAYGMAEATLAITGKPLESLPRAVQFDPEPLRATPSRAVSIDNREPSGPAPRKNGHVIGSPTDLERGLAKGEPNERANARSNAQANEPLNGHVSNRGQGNGAVEPDERQPIEIVSCGVGLAETEVLIVAPDSTEPLAEGRVGEIWVRGPSVADGYWQHVDLTAATFAATPVGSDRTYLRTGDLGFIHDGELFVSGRLKDCLIIAGRNHFAHEIEAVVQSLDPALKVDGGIAFGLDPHGLAEHALPSLANGGPPFSSVDPASRQANVPQPSDGTTPPANLTIGDPFLPGAVAAIEPVDEPTSEPSGEDGERLVIVQEVLRPKRLDLADLVCRIRAGLAEQIGLNVAAIWLVPVGTLPRTSSGKLRRGQCRQDFLASAYEPLFRWPDPNGAAVEPRPPDEADSVHANGHAGGSVQGTSNGRAAARGLRSESRIQPASEFVPADPKPTEPECSATYRTVRKTLEKIWCEVLGLSSAADDQHFLDHGGHSLAALSLVARVRERLGVTVEFDRLFHAPCFGPLLDLVTELVEQQPPQTDGPLPDGPLPDQPLAVPTELSASQRRFWLLDSLGMQQAFLQVELSLRLRGQLAADRLANRIAELPSRHPGLRLRIAVDDAGVPRPSWDDRTPIEIQRLDWREVPAEERTSRLANLRRELASTPFDLERGPVMRAVGVQLDEHESEWILVAHHAACDGWSLRLLIEDLARDASEAGSAEATTIPAVSEPARIDPSELDYWLDRLRDVTPDTQLALADGPGDSVAVCQRSASRFLNVELDGALIERLHQRARDWSVTPMEILLAAWQQVLGGYVETDEIVIGVPVANRDSAAAEHAVGCFINTLPVRLSEPTDRATNFAEWVRAVSGQWREDLRHASVPLDAIIERLAPQRDPDRLPLIQHLMLHQPPAPQGLRIEGADCVGFHSDYATLGAYDTALVCQWRATGSVVNGKPTGSGKPASPLGGCELGVAYNPSRVGDRIAAQMLAGLVAYLDHGLESPAESIDRLPRVGADERCRRDAANRPEPTRFPPSGVSADASSAPLSDTARAPQANPAPATTVLDQFAARVARTPDLVALTDQAGSLSFAGLDRASSRLAARLIARGVVPGSIVALRLGRNRSLVTAALAIWKAGAAYLPLDPHHPPARIAELLADANPAVVLTDEDFPAVLFAENEADWLAGADASDPASVTSVTSELPGATPSGLAYLIYTSGSTGKPKGVAIGHDNLDNVLRSFAACPGLRQGERILACTTISFDISVLELFLPLVTGASAVIPPVGLAEDPDGVKAWLESHPIDVIQATPSSFRMLLACGWHPTQRQRVWCGGEPWDEQLAQQLLSGGGALWNVYGPTETTVWSLIDEVTCPVNAPISIGGPIAATTVRVVDRFGRDVPEGVAGELWIGGRGVGRGYWRDEARTAERFVTTNDGERFYRTGDRVRRLADGRLLFLGRSDRQVKLRGHRIELGEVEATMTHVDGVETAVVVVAGSDANDRRLVGYYRAEPGRDVTPTELRDALRHQLAASSLPANLIRLAEWPHTPAGKVDLRRLTDLAETPDRLPGLIACLTAAGEGDPTSGTTLPRTPPTTATQLAVAEVWRAVLGGDAPALEDHFFELGGHSLLAAQLFARLRAELGVQLPLREIYQHPTLGSLAALVAGIQQAPAAESPAGGSVSLAEMARTAAADPDPTLLSPAEQRLWFVDQLEPNHPFYNLPLAARVEGPLDVARLWRCLDACIARHETLRSTYELVDGHPVRRIADAVVLHPESIDLSGDADAEARCRAGMIERAREPFDLSVGPLVRAIHWKLGPANHVILLVMHHIISDGWSMTVMLRELAELYRRDVAGEPLELPPLPIRYRDYAAWQQRRLTPERIAPAIESYQQELAGATETLDLPVDFPRPAVQDFVGGTRPIELDETTSAAVNQLANALGVTPFSVLLTGLGLTLSRWSNQDDLTLGAAAANRDDAALEGLIGFFVNTIVVRLQSDANPSFAELVRETHRRATEALSHQEVPFERLVERLAKRRDRSHSPLFQSALVLQNLPEPLAPTEGLTITPIPVDNGTAKYDVTLTLFPRAGLYQGQFEYRASLFRPETIDRIADSWRTLLTAAVVAPETPIDGLPLLSPADQPRILDQSIGPCSPNASTPPPTVADQALAEYSTLTASFAAAAAKHADLPAIRHGERAISYAELDRSVDRIARGLEWTVAQEASHAQPGKRALERVVVYLPRGFDQIAATLAVLRRGAAFVPIDPSVPTRRLLEIVRDLEPQALIVPAGRKQELQRQLAERRSETPNETRSNRSEPQVTPPLVACVTVDELASADDGQRHAVEVHGEDLAYLIFTSGSTGQPKGIAIEHRSVSNFVAEFARVLELAPGQRCGHLFSPSFDGAIGDVFPVLASGGCIEVIDHDRVIDPPRLAEVLSRRQVDLVALTPATLAQLEPSRLPAVRKVLSAGAALSGELAAKWLATHRLFNGYGPTECSVGVAIHELGPDDLITPAVGKPFANTRIYVLDPHGRLVPEGVIGEIYLAGRGVARGYWRREELNRHAFLADPFVTTAANESVPPRMFRSGDMGRWNHRGELEIVGRADDQIKLRGFRIEPGEIAAAIERVEGIAAAAVIVDNGPTSANNLAGQTQTARSEPRLVAYVVPRAATTIGGNAAANGGLVATNGGPAAIEPDPPSATDRSAEAAQIESWRQSFETSWSGADEHPATIDELRDDFAGWSSVISGQPIPLDQMRSWADAAASRILSLRPRKVLEIGCGTGLVLLRVVDQVDRYVGIDLLDSAIRRLGQALSSRPEWANKVELSCRTADQLDDFPAGSFDTIVLNSVVQYFPSEEYLIRVLIAAERVLAPGGRIFLGDLRNLRLHRALAIAAELARRDRRELTVGEFRERIENRIERDEELLVDPDLLPHLRPRLGRLREVRALAKTSAGANELTRFRFDAILAFDKPFEQSYGHPSRRQSFPRPPRESAHGQACLRVVSGAALHERAIERRLDTWSADEPLERCLAEVADTPRPGVDPTSLASRAARGGLDLRIELAADGADELWITAASGKRRPGLGRLRRAGWIPRGAIIEKRTAPIHDIAQRVEGITNGSFSNRPRVPRRDAWLIAKLKRELENRLPAYMVPAAFVLLDQLPITVQGKLDRAALPAPPRQRAVGGDGFRAPRSEAERTLVAIWEELLDVSPIGVDDDFFELGGHSMLAVRMAAEWERRTGVNLPLAALFRAPTIERLADWLESPRESSSGLVVPLHQGGAGEPLFCVHPAGGTVFCYRDLAACFAGGRSVYGVQARGLDGLQPPHATVAEMAEDYATAIRAVVPSGPIHLVGWSIGGNIAYEVARRLRAHGREIGLLGLLDAGLLSSSEPVNDDDFLPLIAALFPGQQAASLDELRQQAPEQQLEYFIRQAAIAGIVPEELAAIGPHVFEVFQANVKAVHEHQPGGYDGEMLLIRPADQQRTSALFDDPTLGWGRLVKSVRLASVPGDHAHMLQAPAVGQIAETLQACLRG